MNDAEFKCETEAIRERYGVTPGESAPFERLAYEEAHAQGELEILNLLDTYLGAYKQARLGERGGAGAEASKAPARYVAILTAPDMETEEFDSYEAAQAFLDSYLDHYRDNAPGDGWPEDVAGVVARVEGDIRQTERKPAPEGSSFDYFCDYQVARIDPAR